MLSISPLIQYLVLMAITIIFAILAVNNPKKELFSLLCGFCWFVFGLAHFALGDPASLLTISLSWLFVGLGLIFTVHALITYAHALSDKRYGVDLGE